MASIQDLILTALDTAQSADGGNIASILNNIINQTNTNRTGSWKPCIDIVNNHDTYTIFADLPGVNKNSIDVTFLNNGLYISGDREKNTEEKTLTSEIVTGTFYREIPLPISITSPDNVDINYTNGVLTIVIDKNKERKNKFTMKVGDTKDDEDDEDNEDNEDNENKDDE